MTLWHMLMRKRSRRLKFRIAFGIVAAAGTAFVVFLFLADISASVERPNIIVITTDDQDAASLEARRPDTGAYAFPNIRRIGEEGVRFENSFLSFSLCCPSRATLLTGQYAHNHGVLANVPPHGGYQKLDHANTLPVWLSQADYYTIHIGKYLNGYGEALAAGAAPVPPGWDEWFTLKKPNQFFNYEVVTDGGQAVTFGSRDSDYQTDVLARRAARFLTAKPFGNEPFFMLLDFNAPHVGAPEQGGVSNPAIPAPRHAGVFESYQPIHPPSFNESDVSDKPPHVGVFPLLTSTDIAEVETHMKRRLESLLAVDEGVNLVLKTLQRTGLASHTIVIFTSDNGYEQGEHRIPSGKGLPYEESIRVPLLIRGPGVPAGSVIQKLVTNVDLAPTITELAAATALRTMDGRSVFPLIQNPSIPWREDFLIENPFYNFSVDYAGIRTENLKYVEYQRITHSGQPSSLLSWVELYLYTPTSCGTPADPYELESQHANSCYADLMDELRNRLRTLKNCAGDSCW